MSRLVAWYQRYEQCHALDRMLRRTPAQHWYRRRNAHRPAVLCFHGIEDPEAFEGQLRLLTRIAHPVTLAEFEAAVHEGAELPPHSVLLTFDDGDRSLLTEGLPLLRKYRVPAAAYVIPSLIGTDEPFWWEGLDEASAYEIKQLPDAERRRRLAARPRQAPRRQLDVADLRELAAGGVEIGSHTLSHPCLNRCEEAAVRTEIVEAHRLLTRQLGHPPTSFAYPNGDFDPRAERLLAECGYRSAFLCGNELAAPGLQHPLRATRLVVSTRTTNERLHTALSGLQPAMYRGGRAVVRGAVRGARTARRVLT